MAVSLGHSRDLMTIAQVSYHVTVSVQPRDKLCCFCHYSPTDVGASAIGRAINKEINLMDAGC